MLDKYEVPKYEYLPGQYDDLKVKFNVLQKEFTETLRIAGAYEDFINEKEMMDEFYKFYEEY